MDVAKLPGSVISITEKERGSHAIWQVPLDQLEGPSHFRWAASGISFFRVFHQDPNTHIVNGRSRWRLG